MQHPLSQNEQLGGTGNVRSLWSREAAGQELRHKHAQLETNAEPFTVRGQSTTVAFVSGPRKVRKVLPQSRQAIPSK